MLTNFRLIRSASTQLTELTEDLLFLARSDHAHHPQVQNVSTSNIHTPVNVTAILHDLLQLYTPQAEAKSLSLTFTAVDILYAQGDKVQLTRLFSNLIDNAIRYTPEGGTISVLGEVERTQIKVTVKDTGIGIGPENLDRIFERFWQAEQSRTYQSHGFGLGLAIAHNIVQTHGGQITVTSQLTKAAVSSFTLHVQK